MKAKRTFRLSVTTIEAVRHLVDRGGLATTQDALVDMAIQDLVMAVRHSDETRQYEAGRQNGDLALEADELERDFRPLDAESWPA